MLKIALDREKDSRLNILCLGAHSDDIEIGCFGALNQLFSEYSNICVYWIVFGATEDRAQEAITSANLLLDCVKVKTILIRNFQDGFFPFQGAEIKQVFEEVKGEFSPDLIFTHYRNDLHQDHRLISDLAWNTFRNHLILEYEIPKYDGDLGSPNVFFQLDTAIGQSKVQHLLAHFSSQRERYWFTEDTFLALLRLRGVEARAPGGMAEAFYCRKLAF